MENRTRSIWWELRKTTKMALRKYDTANNEQFVTPIPSVLKILKTVTLGL